MLRPYFLRLRDPLELDRLRERFLEVIRSRFPEDHSLKIKLISWEGDITPDVRAKFRVGLTTNLFGSDDLLSLRMRLSLVDVCWVKFFFTSLPGWCFWLFHSFRNWQVTRKNRWSVVFWLKISSTQSLIESYARSSDTSRLSSRH